MKWTDHGGGIFTALTSWGGVLTRRQDIAYRIDGRGGGGYRVDRKTMSMLPWEAIDGGMPFGSLEAAKKYVVVYHDAVADAESLDAGSRVMKEHLERKPGRTKRVAKKKTERVCSSSGYAYELQPPDVGKTDASWWRRARDDYWDTVLISAKPVKVLGKRVVDGAEVVVFKLGSKVYAQTALHVKKC